MPEMSFSLFFSPKTKSSTVCNVSILLHCVYTWTTVAQRTVYVYVYVYTHTHTLTHTHTSPFSNNYKYCVKKLPVHGMKAYRGCRGKASLILNFSTRWRWVVNFTPWPLTTWREPWIGSWVGPRASLDVLEKRKSLSPAHSTIFLVIW
jgi:hypothetical protein